MTERIIICVGPDAYDVIVVGHRLNDKPLSRAEAYRLAGWSSAGGSSGFSIDGNLVSGRKP
jgi:hypothetical protein